MANYTASDITTDEQAALDQIKEETEAAVKYDIAAKNAKDPATKEAMEHNKKDELQHAGLMGAVATKENPEDKDEMMKGVEELDTIMKKSISECIREKQGRTSSPGSFESFERSKVSRINPVATNKDAMKDIQRVEEGKSPRYPFYDESDADVGLSPEEYRRISYNPMSMLTRLALGLGEREKRAAQNVQDDTFENERYINTDGDETKDVSEEKTGREKRVENAELEEETDGEASESEKAPEKKPLSLSPDLTRLLKLIARDYASGDVPLAVRGDKESTRQLKDWRSRLGQDLIDLVRGADMSDISDRLLSNQKWAQQYLSPYEMSDTNKKYQYDWGTPAFSTYNMDPDTLGTRYNDAVKMLDVIDKLKTISDNSPRGSRAFSDALGMLRKDWEKYLRKVSGAIGWDLAAKNEKTDEYDARAHIFDDQTLGDFEKQFGADRAAALRAGKLKSDDFTDDEMNFINPRAYSISNNDFWRNHAGGFNLGDMMDYYNFLAKGQGVEPGDPLLDQLANTEFKGNKEVEDLFRRLGGMTNKDERKKAIADYINEKIQFDPIAKLKLNTALSNAYRDVSKGLAEIPEEDERYLTRGPRAQFEYNKDVMNSRNKKTAGDILKYAEENEVELPNKIKAVLQNTEKTGNTKDPEDENAESVFEEKVVKDILDQMSGSRSGRAPRYADSDIDQLRAKADKEARKAIDSAESPEDIKQYGVDDESRPPSLKDVEDKYSDFYNKALRDSELASRIADFLPKDDTAKDARRQLGSIGKGWYSDLPGFMDSKVGRTAMVSALRDMASKGEVDLPADFDDSLPLDQGVNRQLISKLISDGKFFNMRGQNEDELLDFLDKEDEVKEDEFGEKPRSTADDLISGRINLGALGHRGLDADTAEDILEDYKTYNDILETGRYGDIDVSDNEALIKQLGANRDDLYRRLTEVTDPEKKRTFSDILDKINLEDNMDKSDARWKLRSRDNIISGAEDFNARKSAIAKDLMSNVPLNLLSIRVPQAYSPKYIADHKNDKWFKPGGGTTSLFDRMMKVYGGRDEYGRPIWNVPKKGDLDKIEDNVRKFILAISNVPEKLEFPDATGKGTDAQAQHEKVSEDRRTENAAYLDSVYPMLNDIFFNGLDVDNYSGERAGDADKFFEMYSAGREAEAPAEATVEEEVPPAAIPEIEVKEEVKEEPEPEKVAVPVKKSATESKCTRVRRRSDADDLPDDTGGLTEKDLKEPKIHDDAKGSSVKHMGDPEIRKSISELMRERMARR